MRNAAPLPTASAIARDGIRVTVVDDSSTVRSLLSRWIGETPGLMLVSALRNGREALDRLDGDRPDVVVLDVEMPELDGISTLPLLLRRRRDLTVIMVSALTRDHAEITLKALSLGAADYVPKPETGAADASSFRRDLIDKIQALGALRARRVRAPRGRGATAPATRRLAGAIQRAAKWRVPDTRARPYQLRPFSEELPRVLLIGASTGGPQALNRLMARLDAVTDTAPVLIAQHMPAEFTSVLAEQLARASAKPAREARHGEPVRAGHIYIAPGGRHMRVERRGGIATVVLDDGPPIHFCKPAVDPLFASAAEVWGPWNLALVLTGMGSDGAMGAAEIAAAGGSVIAQDEATSAVFGMPGAAAEAGVCSAVLPLDSIAPQVVRLFLGARP